MSIKIYNGFRIQADSLDKVLNDISVFKYMAAKLTTKDILKERLIESINILDKAIMNNTIFKEEIEQRKENAKKFDSSKENTNSFKINENSSIISNAESKLLDIFRKNKESQNLDEYAGISIIIYPNAVTIEGKKNYLISLYGDDNLVNWIEKEWKSINIQEYIYYNNTDEPEYVTEEQWELRERHWNQVLLGHGRSSIPVNEGITFNLSRESKYFNYIPEEKYSQYVQEIIEENPEIFTLEKRAEKYAKQHILNEVMERIAAEQGINLYAPLERASIAMNIFFEAEKRLKENSNSEDTNKKEKLEEELKNILLKDITLEDFRKKYQNIIDISAEQYQQLNNTNKFKI